MTEYLGAQSLETEHLSSIPVWPLTSSMTLDKVLNFSLPQFPHLKNEVDDDNKNICLIGLLEELNKIE